MFLHVYQIAFLLLAVFSIVIITVIFVGLILFPEVMDLVTLFQVNKKSTVNKSVTHITKKNKLRIYKLLFMCSDFSVLANKA